MKILKEGGMFFLLALCYGLALLTCTAELEVTPETANAVDNAAVATLDSLSDRLVFLVSTKMRGSAPAALGASSLQFSIEDTLYLVPCIDLSIKFLHLDTSQNIAGAYIQVYNGSTSSQYYFDVPELSDVAESDTVSVIVIGFGCGIGGGVPASAGVEIKITPYNESGQPIDEVTTPVVVVDSSNKADSQTIPDPCVLVNEPGEWWEWVNTHIRKTVSGSGENGNEGFPFYASPLKLFGGEQMIKGCCIDGVSQYTDVCLGTTAERVLPFSTYYQIVSEQIAIRVDGTFTSHKVQRFVNPSPSESDFWAIGGKGVVYTNIDDVTSIGNWTMGTVNIPLDIVSDGFTTSTAPNILFDVTSASSPGIGYNGGMVYFISCERLILVSFDAEGGDQHVFKEFTRRRVSNYDAWPWYPL